MAFIERLHSRFPVLLDGALGTLLPQESQEHALWSTHTVITDPDAIEAIHADYISHGAELIQTSTYQTSEDNVKEWFPENEYRDVVKKSIDLAYAAKLKSSSDEVFIAGSVGPYGASLANGAEYTGDYGEITPENIEAFHQERLRILCDDDRVDIIALETIPNISEIAVLIGMMKEIKKPYYLSLSVKQETLADGSSVSALLEVLGTAGENLVCVGVNCLALDLSLQWLSKLEPLKKGLVVYPNSGELYVDRHWVQDSPERQLSWDEYVQRLKSIGDVRIVGGCCRTTPEIISEIKCAIRTHF